MLHVVWETSRRDLGANPSVPTGSIRKSESMGQTERGTEWPGLPLLLWYTSHKSHVFANHMHAAAPSWFLLWLTLQAKCSREPSIDFQRTTRSYNPRDRNPASDPSLWDTDCTPILRDIHDIELQLIAEIRTRDIPVYCAVIWYCRDDDYGVYLLNSRWKTDIKRNPQGTDCRRRLGSSGSA
jgi:hypothetical protein